MIKSMFILFFIFSSVAVKAEEVYKNTKSDGSVEFTDRKSTGSQKIKISEPIIYQAPDLPRLKLPDKKLSPEFNYSIKILQPTNEASIINSQSVLVSIALQPEMKKGYGHKIRYQLAGKSITSLSSSVVFNEIPRGEHKLLVSIIDEKEEVVSPEASVTFYVKRFFKKPSPAQAK